MVEPSGTVEVSSSPSLAPGDAIGDVWPGVRLDLPGVPQVLEGATLTVRSDDAGVVVDVESQLDDELEVLRWSDVHRTLLRDAADGADLVLAAIGELLGLDAVDLRSFDGPDRSWVADGVEPGAPLRGDGDDEARRWSETVHLVTDVERAPWIDGRPLDRSAIARPPEAVLRSGPAAIVSVPLRFDGSHRGELVGWAAAPIDPRGARVREAVVALATDLAARRMRAPVEHVDAHEVLAAIGHDLRSPLRAVANYAELLAVPDDPVDDELVAFTSRMHMAARQANEQLDGLVEFLDAGTPERCAELDLDRAFDQIEASWTTSLSAVTIERPRRLLRPRVGGSLVQALAILVENSVAVRRRAAPITLAVHTEPMVAGGCRIVLVDAGPGALRGISAFRWSDGTRSPATVGPLLAGHIVELLGGRLLVEAEPEVATTWTIELPGG